MRTSLTALAIVGAATMWAGNAAADGPATSAAPGTPTVIVVQQPGAQPPPAGYGQPPPGYYGQPPPGYGQPPPGGYYAPAPGYAPTPGYTTAPMGPRYLDYEEGDAIPPGYRTGTRIRKGLVIGGSVMFGVSYLITIFAAGIGQAVTNINETSTKDFGPLLIPIAGPFIGISTTHASSGGAFGLAFLGITQTAGLGMLIAGIAAPKTVLVRNEVGRVKFTVVPQIGATSTGLGMVGTF
jgi:hypothetical protein